MMCSVLRATSCTLPGLKFYLCAGRQGRVRLVTDTPGAGTPYVRADGVALAVCTGTGDRAEMLGAAPVPDPVLLGFLATGDLTYIWPYLAVCAPGPGPM